MDCAAPTYARSIFVPEIARKCGFVSETTTNSLGWEGCCVLCGAEKSSWSAMGCTHRSSIPSSSLKTLSAHKTATSFKTPIVQQHARWRAGRMMRSSTLMAAQSTRNSNSAHSSAGEVHPEEWGQVQNSRGALSGLASLKTPIIGGCSSPCAMARRIAHWKAKSAFCNDFAGSVPPSCRLLRPLPSFQNSFLRRIRQSLASC